MHFWNLKCKLFCDTHQAIDTDTYPNGPFSTIDDAMHLTLNDNHITYHLH